MCAEIFRGKPVLSCGNASDHFYVDLFLMLADALGHECIINKDEVCSYHFRALVNRLCDLCYPDDTSGDISEELIVFLGDARA